MKSMWFVYLLCATHLPCVAKDNEQQKANAIDTLRAHCGYDLGKGIKNSIISGKTEERNFDSAKYANLEFKIDLRLLKKKTTANIRFNCITEGKSPSEPQSLTPAQLIQQEDAGGRYFRHIAWQQRISGDNWSGLVAYSDYLFGDGQKSPTYIYFICQARSQCFDFEISPAVKLTSKEREIALGLVRKISYKN
jgi:hypothetical protein